MGESYTGADLFVDALAEYDVEYLFGNPGTTELPIVRAVEDRDVEYSLALHEDVAVGMAAGYASTRRYQSHADPSVRPVGVVNLHITPGLAHGLSNIFGAEYSGVPMVVTVGNNERDFRVEEPILTGNLVSMAEPHTKWSDEVLDVNALPTMLRRAFRVALTPPTGPVFLALPLDVMGEETDADPEPLGPIPSAGRGDPGQIDRAADLLAGADEPVLVVGDGVARSGAVDAAVALAEASGARVHGEIFAGEANFPQAHEQWVSHVPPDGEVATRIFDTDALVFVGVSTNTTLLSHEGGLFPDDATTVHVSGDAWELGKNVPADAAVLGDPGLVMADLAEQVHDRIDESERERRLERVEDAAAEFAADVRAMFESERPEDPRPSKAAVVDALREVAPDAYLVDEGVTARNALLTRWPFEAEGFLSTKSGGLGYGLPASIGAAVAEERREDPRKVVAHVGDGAFLYYPHAVFSAVRQDLDMTVVVQNNRRYRILQRNAAKLFGGSADEQGLPGVDLDPHVDYVQNVESYGATGFQVDDPDELHDTLEEAIETDGPSVVNVEVHD